MSIRQIYEGKQEQGSTEKIVYQLSVTKWNPLGSAVSNPAATAYLLKKDGGVNDIEDDVTSTVMPSGSASVVDDLITLPPLQLLTKNRVYRIDVEFTIDGNIMDAYAIIECRR